MFHANGVVHVVAPTEMNAFNVLGKTLYRFAGLDWKNMQNEMMKRTQERLLKNLQNAIAILMDERSMLGQLILGLAERSVARTAHECGHSSEYWGVSCHGLVWG
jgi:hypothetical protein